MEKTSPCPTIRRWRNFATRSAAFCISAKQACTRAGLEPQQHQLMLALKGLPEGVRPRIGELAERLQIQHHSAVELVNRLEAGGYVRRQRAQAGPARGAACPYRARANGCCASLSIAITSELRTAARRC